MNKIYKRSFIGMLVLAVSAMTLAPLLLQARPPKSEDELIAQLASPKERDVINALEQIEKSFAALISDKRDKCPACKGSIPDGATKCMHCGETIQKLNQIKL